MTYTKKERESYNVHRDWICKRLEITKNQYNWFRRKGEILHKNAEDYCNGVEGAEFDGVAKKTCEDVVIKARQLKLYFFHQTDPRGATIYLDKEEIPQNNYTNACCIY